MVDYSNGKRKNAHLSVIADSDVMSGNIIENDDWQDKPPNISFEETVTNIPTTHAQMEQ